MTNKNVILKDGADYLYPKTKTEIVVDVNDKTLDTILSEKADLVDGKIPSSQLPSYVDDVVEVTLVQDAVQPAALFEEGDTHFSPIAGKIYTLVGGDWDEGINAQKGVIYVETKTNKVYRWTGNTAIEIATTDISSKQDTINTVGLLKGTGSGHITTASAGVDYAVADHKHNVADISDFTASATELNYVKGVTSSIQTQLDNKAALASPALTGIPTAPTAAEGTNNTQIATTAFVQNAIANLSSMSYEEI